MYLTLHPDAHREGALQALEHVHTKVSNLYTGFSGDAGQLVLAYLEWANDAFSHLEGRISETDIDRLIFTRRYEHMLAGATELGAAHVVRFTNSLVRLELGVRSRELALAVNALKEAIANRPAVALNAVFDTSLFIHHPEKLDAIDWVALTGLSEGAVNLMIPMVVIDELDRTKDTHSKGDVRGRARVALAVIDRLFPKGDETFPVLQKGGAGGLDVTVEIMFDPPRHTRLPIADDEIVDRTLALRPMVGDAPVTLFTYDTGQSTRARYAGLDARKLRQRD
ncbi:PIN domain-containing protein [Kitasatospora sp. NPDC127116]|uniref:PIN domain-containing protein n=1 Tax=Kitasatospora sp. NPDC127116 TaxID=3345367 RepID=UPI003630C17D